MAGNTKTRNVMSQSTSRAEEVGDVLSAGGASCKGLLPEADGECRSHSILAATRTVVVHVSGLVVVNLPVSPRGCRALQLVQACLDEQSDLHAASCVCRIAQNVDWPMPRFSCRPELQWGIYIEIFRRRLSQAGRSTAELVA